MSDVVIVALPRTGSSLLGSLLASHPRVHCDGEIFAPEHGYGRYAAVRRHPRAYLRARRQLQLWRHAKAVYGFKLMPHHLAATGDFLQRLQTSGWKVVHLQRRSLFDHAMSQAVAMTTGHWHTKGVSRAAGESLTVPLQTFLEEVDSLHREDARLTQRVDAMPHLRLTYESDLETPETWPAMSLRLVDFLGLPPAALRTTLHRPWSAPYRTMVANYGELERAFGRHVATSRAGAGDDGGA